MNLVTEIKVNKTEFTKTYVYMCVCVHLYTRLYIDVWGGKSKNLRLIFKGISV